jgi:HD-like signal output (HDOD) protein
MIEITNKQNRLEFIQNTISSMPSLSTTVTKVLEICHNPKTSPNDLNRVISLDPVLTAQVLKVINSAYYSLPKRVSSLTRAIIMLGLNTVVNLAVSTAVLASFDGRESFQVLSMDEFWTHSLCVGVTSKCIAGLKAVPVTEREEYFLAGLLHDLGKIPLNKHFSDEYFLALDLARRDQGPLHPAESRILGFDHSTVGKMIAEKWNLGESTRDALCQHHDPEGACEDNRQLIAAVALANTYSNLFEIGTSGDSFPEERMVMYLLKTVGVSWTELSGLHETVLDEIEKARIFLQVAQAG